MAHNRQMLLATVALIAVATPSYAQTVPDPAPQATEAPAQTPEEDTEAAPGEIVVTAQRREQRLQDVPLSVAVVSGENIRKGGTVDLIDLSTRLPGVHIGTNSTSNNIQLRGIGSGVNGGFEQAVGIFVDGVYRPRSRSVQATLFDIERVEVLNGPQTTFFGNNTVAGAINITTRKPSRDFGYNASALYAPTDGQLILEAGVTGPISDNLAVRVSGQYSQMDGYTKNTLTNDYGPHLRDFIVRGSLHWTPTQFWTSDFRVEHVHQRDKSTYLGEITGCPPPAGYPSTRGPCALYIALRGTTDVDNKLNFVADTGPSSFDLDMTELAWTNRFDLGPVALNFLTSYSDLDDTTFGNFTPIPVTGRAGYYYSPSRFGEKFNLFTQEVRLESTGKGPIDYMVGAYYSRGNLKNDSYSSLFGTTIGASGAPVTNANTPIGTNRTLDQIDQTRSVFGQVTWRITDQLRVNGGLRYTSVLKDAHRSARIGIAGNEALPSQFTELDLATQAKLYSGAGISPADYVDPHTKYEKLMPSASVQYDIVGNLTAYASYTNGFKSGGYSDSNTPVQFDSESVDAYEIGIKGSAFDRALFFTLDGFYEKFSGLQQAVNIIGPTGASIQSVNNASSAISKGVEFTGTVRVSDMLSFNLSGTYLKATYESYPGAACTTLQIVVAGASCVQDLSGKKAAFAPEFTGSAGFTLAVPIGEQELRFEPNIFHSSSYYLTATNDPLVFQKGYEQYDMRVAFGPSDRSWEIAVIGKNLSNEAVQNTTTVLAASPGMAYSILQRARSVAFSISIKH